MIIFSLIIILLICFEILKNYIYFILYYIFIYMNFIAYNFQDFLQKFELNKKI